MSVAVLPRRRALLLPGPRFPGRDYSKIHGNMAGNLKLRIDPPSKFSGKENYEEFAKKLRNYMCLSDLRYAAEMTWATKRITPITVETLRERDVDEKHEGHTEKLSSLFYYVLSGLVEGPAYTIVDQIDDANGFEAWRRLHQRYAKTKLQSAIMQLVTIVNTKFQEKSFETTFAEWETNITKFEMAVGRELYDEIKVGLLIAGTTGKLHDHLGLSVTEVVDYDSVRQIVLHYFKSKTLTTNTSKSSHEDGRDPMDIGAIKG